MGLDSIPAHFIGDARIDATLGRLYAATLSTDPSVRQRASARGLDEGSSGFYEAMGDAYMPVTPDLGKLLYLLVRATGATTVIEFGTSFGISAIWMAAALRLNGRGRLITTEMNTAKVACARANLREAGLDDLVDICAGRAELTLRPPFSERPGLVFLDGAKAAYLDVLRVLEPHLQCGAMIVADNTEMESARPFLDYVQAPCNGYQSAQIVTEALGDRHPCMVVLRVRDSP